MDEVEPCLDERWSDLAIFIDRQSAGQQVVTVESRAQQPPRPELCPHRCNHFAREAQPVLKPACTALRVASVWSCTIRAISSRVSSIGTRFPGAHAIADGASAGGSDTT